MKGAFKISNPASGVILGVYPGDTEAEALDSLARDAGYRDYAAACGVTGDDPDDPDLIIEDVSPE